MEVVSFTSPAATQLGGVGHQGEPKLGIGEYSLVHVPLPLIQDLTVLQLQGHLHQGLLKLPDPEQEART